jgi:formamidopyrimidine-DNA glycosylase
MPELPEVETVVRQLLYCGRMLNNPITGVKIFRPQRWINYPAEKIEARLMGRSFKNISRRAKFIIFSVDDDSELIIHLRMTGKLMCLENPIDDPYIREVFYFADGSQLLFIDTRTLGRLYFKESSEKLPVLERLGIEPLSFQFTREKLQALLNHFNLDMKSFLMDQSKIAGIGNIYASEILYLCRINPQRSTRSITMEEIDRLHEIIPEILNRSIKFKGTTIADFRNAENQTGEFQKYLQVYGNNGESCPICQTRIQRIVQKQRSTFFCPNCQK